MCPEQTQSVKMNLNNLLNAEVTGSVCCRHNVSVLLLLIVLAHLVQPYLYLIAWKAIAECVKDILLE